MFRMPDKEEQMKKLSSEVGHCKDCGLCENANNRVMGKGNLETGIVFVGEAPGADEDEQGRPFVGHAGQLLNKIFEGLSIERSEVYITNLVKCRPPSNRKPHKNEIDECSKHLERELEIIKPIIIAPMGNTSLKYIMKRLGFKPRSIGDIHGKKLNATMDFGSVSIFPLYHPAAAIYNRSLLPILEKDLKIVLNSIKKL